MWNNHLLIYLSPEIRLLILWVSPVPEAFLISLIPARCIPFYPLFLARFFLVFRLAASSRIFFFIISLICDISADCGAVWKELAILFCGFVLSGCFSIFPESWGSITYLFSWKSHTGQTLFPDTKHWSSTFMVCCQHCPSFSRALLFFWILSSECFANHHITESLFKQ